VSWTRRAYRRRAAFRLGEGSYQLTMASLGIQFTVDRLRVDQRHELIGELAVGCDLPGARVVDGYLSVAD
jgi:hypothetical protein